MAKLRLDQMLVDRHLAESREKAQRYIRAGQVRVNGQVHSKPGKTYAGDVEITLDSGDKYVSRGGDKLDGAMQEWPVELKGRVCIDVGSSTGGFTDCMLQNGARQVYAVDVGTGQLHWKLRNDERVVVMEQTNARELQPRQFDPPPEFVSVDVSFISLTKVLPAVTKVVADRAEMVSLIKPQFEAERHQVKRGGVVREEAVHVEVVEKVRNFVTRELGWECMGVLPSPLKGPSGNIEFLAYWKIQK